MVDRDGNGDAASIRVGAIGDPSAGGSAPETDPSTYPPLCPEEPGVAGTVRVISGNTGQEGFVLPHTIERADAWRSPAEVVAAAPDGWIAVEGRLLVSQDGFVQLCADVDGERCIGGATVRGIDGVGLLVNVVIRTRSGTATSRACGSPASTTDSCATSAGSSSYPRPDGRTGASASFTSTRARSYRMWGGTGSRCPTAMRETRLVEYAK